MQSWLSKRIAVLSLAPAIILVLFIVYNLVLSFSQLSTTSLTKTESALAQLTNNAISQIQKERGMSAGFVSSDGTKFKAEIQNQRTLVNDAIARVIAFKELENIPDIATQLLPQLRDFETKLRSVREQVDSLTASVPQIVTLYSAGTKMLLDYNGRMVASVKNALGKQKFVLLYKLALLQENAGLERALLSAIFANGSVSDDQHVRAKNLFDTQSAYQNDIAVLSTPEFLSEFNLFLASSENKAINQFREQVQISQLSATPEQWFAKATSRIDKIHALINVLFSQLNIHADEQYNAAFATVIFDIVLLIIVCILAYSTYTVLTLRKRQSSELQTKLQDIHTQQDLNIKIEQISLDDLGEVTQLLNNFIAQFKDDLIVFQNNAHEIATASEQSASSSSATSKNIVEQQNNISTSLMLAESVDIAINEDIKSIAQLTEYARASATKVKNSEVTVKSAVQGIYGTAQEVRNVGKTIEELNTRVADILSMVDVIRSVADQTNLLALNAAIEAARAGEQGRGFAVVADEVRALAKRTQDSTEEIAKVVDELNASSTKAFESIATGEETANHAVQSADEINLALADVSLNMKELETLAVNADQSAQQQGSSINFLTQNIRSVDTFSTENAVSSEQVASAAYQLSRVAEAMLKNIQKYKV